MQKIECSTEPLTTTELEVRNRLTHDPRESLYARLDMAEILNSLTGKQRECFKLVALHGLTEREAAKELGLSKGSVQVYLKRARNKLKELIKFSA